MMDANTNALLKVLEEFMVAFIVGSGRSSDLEIELNKQHQRGAGDDVLLSCVFLFRGGLARLPFDGQTNGGKEMAGKVLTT